MDMSDVNKVAIRKRMNTDAGSLREKMNRESSKVIKLRVAQDTAYWDVQERLAGVEAAHERLQQNMLDVQMQHEKLSATYQDELRLRPETLNKLASTREICDVLEEYVGRVRLSVRRAAADRAALAQSYAAAAERVHGVLAQHAAGMDQASGQISVLTDKLKASTEHNSQLSSLLSEAQRQAEAREAAASALLAAAGERADQLRARCELLAERNHGATAQLQVQERYIAELKQEVERRAAEAKAEGEAAATLKEQLQKQAEALSNNLSTSEAQCEAASRECSRLQELLAAAETKVSYFAGETEKLKGIVQNLEAVGADLKRELELSGAKTETLQKLIEDKERENQEHLARLDESRRQLSETRAALDATESKLRATADELEAERSARAADCAAAKDELQALEARSAAASAATERELAERARTVAQLMRDVAAEGEARARADAQLTAARAQLDLAAQAREQLNEKLHSKEKELAGQMKIILETRSEKERLHEKICGMQGTIDNIQKELIREPPAPAAARREAPEHDDNARDAAPPPTNLKHKKKGICAKSPKRDRVLFRSPQPRTVDDPLYHFLSDSSVDGDMIDPVKVNARFEAMSRGEAAPPTSLHALKRRRAEQRAPAADDEISMSQVRADLVNRGRCFFRNKRLDAKPKNK